MDENAQDFGTNDQPRAKIIEPAGKAQEPRARRAGEAGGVGRRIRGRTEFLAFDFTMSSDTNRTKVGRAKVARVS